MAHFMVNMHKSHMVWLCNVNEFLKNGLKWVVLAKKSLQNPLIYYKMNKRGMTYDDVGGYQLRPMQLISTENVRIVNSGGTVTVIGVLCPG